MAKKILRAPFYKIEKVYRFFISILFYLTAFVLLSAIIAVPIFASETSYILMLCYSIYYYIFCAGIFACCILGFASSIKTKNENLFVQGGLHLISTILTILNWKFFTVIFLFGIKKDAIAEKIIGSDADVFIAKAQENWISLIVAIILTGIIAILSTMKIAKEKPN